MDSVSCEEVGQMSSCFEEQLCELEMLQSMYSKDEMSFDSDCAPYVLSYCERGSSCEETLSDIISTLNVEDLSLGFTLKLLLQSHAVEVKCDLPRLYPHKTSPVLFVRTSGIVSRQKQSIFRQSMTQFIDGLDKGEPVLFTILDWISGNLPAFVELEEKTSVESQQDVPCTFTRMWIYSHHIYSKFKRRDIIAWADELSLHGFSMCGKPGMICVEGHTEDVDEYWSRLRRLNWKRLVMKEKEDTSCDSLSQLKELYRFGVFKEMVFGEGKGGAGGFHSDIGLLRKFLQEHDSCYMFEIYFGIDGGSAESADT